MFSTFDNGTLHAEYFFFRSYVSPYNFFECFVEFPPYILLFIHCTVLIRTLQNPTSAVFTIMLHVYVAESFCRSLTFLWCTLHNLSFAGFELQVRQNRDGLPSPVHFFDQQTCIW